MPSTTVVLRGRAEAWVATLFGGAAPTVYARYQVADGVTCDLRRWALDDVVYAEERVDLVLASPGAVYKVLTNLLFAGRRCFEWHHDPNAAGEPFYNAATGGYWGISQIGVEEQYENIYSYLPPVDVYPSVIYRYAAGADQLMAALGAGAESVTTGNSDYTVGTGGPVVSVPSYTYHFTGAADFTLQAGVQRLVLEDTVLPTGNHSFQYYALMGLRLTGPSAVWHGEAIGDDVTFSTFTDGDRYDELFATEHWVDPASLVPV